MTIQRSSSAISAATADFFGYRGFLYYGYLRAVEGRRVT